MHVLAVCHRHIAGLRCSETGRTCLVDIHLEEEDLLPGWPELVNEPRLLGQPSYEPQDDSWMKGGTRKAT